MTAALPVLSNSKNVTIDLNGKTITNSKSIFINQTKSGGYTFTGSGSIKATYSTGNLRTGDSSAKIIFDENFAGSVEYNTANNNSGGTIQFKGGYLKPKSGFTYETYYDKFIPDGYALVAVTEGDYADFYHVEALTAENASWQVGDTYFASLDKAQTEWSKTDGSTLKLLNNLDGIGVVADLGSGKSLTLDLNGKTLSLPSNDTGYLVKVSSGTLTITGNGTFTGDNSKGVIVDGTGSLHVVNGGFNVPISFDNSNGELIIDGGTFEKGFTHSQSIAKYEINGGTFSATISAGYGETCTVNGGIFNGGLGFTCQAGTLEIKGGDIAYVNSAKSTVDDVEYKGTVNVSGGIIHNFYSKDQATWNITGGSFGVNPGEVASGYKVAQNGDYWVVTED